MQIKYSHCFSTQNTASLGWSVFGIHPPCELSAASKVQFYSAMNTSSCSKHCPGDRYSRLGTPGPEQELQLLETGLDQPSSSTALVSPPVSLDGCTSHRNHWGFSSALCMTHNLWQSSSKYSCHHAQMGKPSQKFLLYRSYLASLSIKWF